MKKIYAHILCILCTLSSRVYALQYPNLSPKTPNQPIQHHQSISNPNVYPHLRITRYPNPSVQDQRESIILYLYLRQLEEQYWKTSDTVEQRNKNKCHPTPKTTNVKAPTVGFGQHGSGNDSTNCIEDGENGVQARYLVRPDERSDERPCGGWKAVAEGVEYYRLRERLV